MNTKQCKFCATEIPHKSKRCPNCTKRVSMGWYGPALVIALLVAIGRGIIG